MKRMLFVAGLAGLAVMGWLWLKTGERPPSPADRGLNGSQPSPAVAASAPVVRPAPAVAPRSVQPLAEAAPSSDAVAWATPAGAATAITDPSGLAPEIVLENMRATVRQYASAFGGNPVGNNLEITQALEGKNPKGIHFLKLEGGLRKNEAGELIDSWGTPYFFHQLSAQEMEVRSAGPDRIMWTADDLANK